MFLAFAGVFLSVLVWWLCIRPSHDRHVATRGRGRCLGRSLTAIACASPVFAISNTARRDDFTVRYEERECRFRI
mgnify:CR=1 FL=1